MFSRILAKLTGESAEQRATPFYPLITKPVGEIDLCTLIGRDLSDHVCMYWVPRTLDVARIAAVAELLPRLRDGLPVIGEVGGGSGLLGYLLAQTGLARVVVTEPDERLVKDTPYQHQNLEILQGDASSAKEIFRKRGVNLVLNSWMPEGVNLTPAIREVGAAGILYVRDSTNVTGATRPPRGLSDIELSDYLSYHPGTTYRRVLRWDGFERNEVQGVMNHTRGRFAIRSAEFELQIREDLPGIRLPKLPKEQLFPRYPWELEMRDIFRLKGEETRLQGNGVEYLDR